MKKFFLGILLAVIFLSGVVLAQELTLKETVGALGETIHYNGLKLVYTGNPNDKTITLLYFNFELKDWVPITIVKPTYNIELQNVDPNFEVILKKKNGRHGTYLLLPLEKSLIRIMQKPDNWPW